MENHISKSGRGRKSFGSLKEGLSDIRDRIQENKGVGWREIISFATAIGTVGAVALGRRLFPDHSISPSPSRKSPNAKKTVGTKKSKAKR